MSSKSIFYTPRRHKQRREKRKYSDQQHTEHKHRKQKHHNDIDNDNYPLSLDSNNQRKSLTIHRLSHIQYPLQPLAIQHLAFTHTRTHILSQHTYLAAVRSNNSIEIYNVYNTDTDEGNDNKQNGNARIYELY